MVSLTWEKKTDANINFAKLKKEYSNYFEDFVDNLSFDNEQILTNSKFSGWKNK